MKPLDRFRLIRRLTLPGSAKCLLLVLASHADKDGVCWPGLHLLAQETGFCVRTVRSAYRVLQLQGLLILGHRRGQSTKVILTLDAFTKLLATPATIAAPPRQPLPPEVAQVKAVTAQPRRKPWTLPCSNCHKLMRSTLPASQALCRECRNTATVADTTPRNVVALFPEARK